MLAQDVERRVSDRLGHPAQPTGGSDFQGELGTMAVAGHGHRLRVATAVSGTSGDSTAPRTTPRDITALAVASSAVARTLASDS